MAIISILATQVTVKRLFSYLKHTLTDNRMRMRDAMIEKIMILKMNQDLLPQVVDVLIESDK